VTYSIDDAADEVQSLTVHQLVDEGADFRESLNSIVETLAQARYDEYQQGLLDSLVDNQIKSRKEDSYE